jgi:putative protease
MGLWDFFRKKRPLPKKKTAISKKKTPHLKEELIGRITHYFPKVKAGVVKITRGSLCLGDFVHIKGHTTDFKQRISSLQINKQPIKRAVKGKLVGLRVIHRVRKKDKVYKIKSRS